MLACSGRILVFTSSLSSTSSRGEPAAAGGLPWGRTAGPTAARPAGGLRWQPRLAVVWPGRCPCAHPVESARVHRVWVRSFHRPGLESQPDKHAVNVRPIYEPLRRGVWTIPVSLFVHMEGVVFSQLGALS